MIRLAILAVTLAFTTQMAMADANFIPLGGKDSKPGEYGYTIRTVDNMNDVTSEGHRKMVKAFTAGIEKLPK